MSAAWIDAYVGIGGNLGDRAGNLRGAADRLAGLAGVACVQRSHIYETGPVGGPADQPDYLNAVIHLRTILSARELLRRCLEIEAQMGRVRGQRCGPRTIDLDVLLFGDTVSSSVDLLIPHPRLAERRFVLVPLIEIAPELIHPGTGWRCADLLAELSADDQNVRPTELCW